MGTNYYGRIIPTEEKKEEMINAIRDGRYLDAISLLPYQVHIGKSSAGWQFCFNHNNWEYFGKSVESLKEFLSSCLIYDEYGESISFDDFWQFVESKKDGLDHKKYMDKWDEIHPNQSKPYYANEELDFHIDGIKFSTHTQFS